MKYINEYNNYERNLLYQGDNKAKFFIASLLKGLETEENKAYVNTLFIHKDTGKLMMIYHIQPKKLFVSYEHIWEKIETKFNYSNSKMRELIKHTVEVAFKIDITGVYLL